MKLPEEQDYYVDLLPEESLTTSREINEISAALSASLDSIKDIPKNTQAFNYKYAPLESYTPMIREGCKKNGLFVMQPPISRPGKIGVATMITHSSGQWIRSEVLVDFDASQHKNVAQAVGSLHTYLRRYCLSGIWAIAAHGEDFDAQDITVPEQKPKAKPASDKLIAKLNKAAQGGKESLTKAFADLTPAMKESLTSAQVAAFKETARAVSNAN